MPLVAPISRMSTASQHPSRRPTAGLAGSLGAVVFALLLLTTTVDWSRTALVHSNSVTEGGSAEVSASNPDTGRLLSAHRNLNSFGLLHGGPAPE